MVDINKPITNPRLVENIEEIIVNQNVENEYELINEMLKAHFLTPVVISPKPNSNKGKTVLKEETTIDFVGITNTDDENFLLAFTDWNELGKWNDEQNQQTIIFKFTDLSTIILEGEEQWDGFVINPFGGNLILENERIQEINDSFIQVEKGDSVMLGVPKEYPHELINAISKYLMRIEFVKRAYFMLMIQNDDMSYLIVVDTTINSQEMIEGIAKVAKPYLNRDEKIDIVPLNSSFSKQAIKGKTPFYKKGI